MLQEEFVNTNIPSKPRSDEDLLVPVLDESSPVYQLGMRCTALHHLEVNMNYTDSESGILCVCCVFGGGGVDFF